MDDNKMLKLVYTFFLGVLIAVFIGVGVNTFYSSPKAPTYPPAIYDSSKQEPSAEQLAEQKTYDTSYTAYNERMQTYNRNVSMVTLGAAVVLLAASILYEKRIKVIADGVMLGGLFTLLYSIGRGFASDNDKYVFIVVSAGLAIVLYLGYHRFVRRDEAPAKSKHK